MQREKTVVALPESFDPDKTDIPQSGLGLLMFRPSWGSDPCCRVGDGGRSSMAPCWYHRPLQASGAVAQVI